MEKNCGEKDDFEDSDIARKIFLSRYYERILHMILILHAVSLDMKASLLVCTS